MLTIYESPLEKQNADALILVANQDTLTRDDAALKTANAAVVRGELAGRKFVLALGCAAAPEQRAAAVDAAARAVGARPPPRELWLNFPDFPEHCEHQRAQVGAVPKLYELVGDIWRFKTALRYES